MHTLLSTPPGPGEHSPLHAPYLAVVGERDPRTLLAEQPDRLSRACRSLTEAQALYRYAPGKWSVKEVVGHICDTERILTYRLLRIARGDATPLSGFEEDAYVAAAFFDDRPLVELVEDFAVVRENTRRLLQGIPMDAWTHAGIANGQPISARALYYIIPGHVEHHLLLLHGRYGLSPG